MLGYQDYGARFYDPTIGRWSVPDVLGEIRTHESPYCYVGNNPVSRIDPDGRKWKDGDDGENAKQANADIKSLETVNKGLSKKIEKYDQKIEKAKNDGKDNRISKLEVKKADAQNRICYNNLAIASIKQMASDPEKVFRYGNSFTTENQGAVSYSTAAMARDADGTYVINNSGTLASRVHEEVHGGQIAFGLVDIQAGTTQPINLKTWPGWLETQAYRAEYAVSGRIFFPVKDLLEITPRSIHSADPKTYPSLR